MRNNNDLLIKELATRNNTINFFNLATQYLPNPDPILKKQGKDVSAYKALLTDDRLGGCIKSRKAGVKSLLWGLDRGKSKSRYAKIMEDCFYDLKVREIISSILNAPLFGYAVLEIIWDIVDGKILPVDVIEKPQEWFAFSDDNKLLLKTKVNPDGQLVPENKFLLVQYESSYVNPYGFAELSRCFWPVTFKKGGMKFWLQFIEKYGMPYTVGKQPRGAGDEETKAMLEQLENMIQDAVAVVPDDSSVEIIAATGKADSSTVFETFKKNCEEQIAITILGQNLTTEIQGGSYAATKGHLEVRQDIVDEDKHLCEETLNRLIDIVFELNFGDIERPMFSMWQEEDVDSALADRDQKLTASMQISGLKLSKSYYQKNYGLTDEDIVESSVTQFAESNGDATQIAVDQAVESISPEELQKEMEGVLKPIIDLIRQGESYEEIMSELVGTFPDMKTDDVQKMLERAIFVSELWGLLNARKD